MHDAAMNEDTKRYAFHISTDNEYIEWRGLTRAQAVHMYNLTEKNPPVGVVDCGWTEEK